MDNMDGNKADVPAMTAVAMGIIQVTMLELRNIPSGKLVNGKNANLRCQASLKFHLRNASDC